MQRARTRAGKIKQAIERRQFEPSDAAWDATVKRQLRNLQNEEEPYNDGPTDSENEDKYGDLLQDDNNIRLGTWDYRTILEGPADKPEQYYSVTQNVVNSYIRCVCAYKNGKETKQICMGDNKKKPSRNNAGQKEGPGKKRERIEDENSRPKSKKGRQGGKPEVGKIPSPNRTPREEEEDSVASDDSERSGKLEEPGRSEKGEDSEDSDLTEFSDLSWPSGLSELPELPRKSERFHDLDDFEPPTSCAMFPCRVWDKLCHSQAYSDPQNSAYYLKQIDCEGDNFEKLDFFFCPNYQDRGHYQLLGLAPKQKFAFLIDGYQRKRYHRRAQQVRPLMQILFDRFEDESDEWPMYGSWALRNKKKMDRSPDAARQRDLYNCGIFTITNALCLAFGYNLLCYEQKDLDAGKRPRVAAELLHGGFNSPFNCPLLDIPMRMIDTIIDEKGNEAWLPANNPDTESEDTDSGVTDSGPDSGPPKRIRKPPKPIIIRKGLHPAQFDPGSFQKAGFMYVIKEPMFKELKIKRELIAACRKYEIKGYTWWSRSSVKVFRRWMENEMVGRKEEGSGGLVPFPGVAKAVRKTKKKSVGKKEEVRKKREVGKKPKTESKPQPELVRKYSRRSQRLIDRNTGGRGRTFPH